MKIREKEKKTKNAVSFFHDKKLYLFVVQLAEQEQIAKFRSSRPQFSQSLEQP